MHAALDGIDRGLAAGRATDAPYAGTAPALPTSLEEALDALAADRVLGQAFGEPMIGCVQRVKRFECERHAQSDDSDEWQRREYFSRF